MLKNKFKIITLLIVIILAITIPVVRAENEAGIDTSAENNEGIMPISEGQNETPDVATPEATNQDTTQGTENVADNNFKKGDVYLTGDNVVIDYIIDGNLFITANTVTINSQVGGDAFICANSVTVGEQGYIFSNLFTVAENVDVKGVVYDVYAFSNDVTISGYVYRDIKVGSKNLNIYGTVGRNAFVNCANISFTKSDTSSENAETNITSQGMINGNLEYTSKQELSLAEGAVVGETKYTPASSINTISTYLISLGAFVVTTIIIWLLCLWIAPKFLSKTSNLVSKRILPVIGLGIVTPIMFAIVSIILLILGITANIAILAMILLVLLMLISTSIFVISINNFVCKKMKIEKTSITFGMLIISAIVLWILTLIPVAGSIISLIISILGLGIIVSNFILKDKKDKSEMKVEEKA